MKKLLFALCICFSISVEASILYSDENVQISGKCENGKPHGLITIVDKKPNYPDMTFKMFFTNGSLDINKAVSIDVGSKGYYTNYYLKPASTDYSNVYMVKYGVYKKEYFNTKYSNTKPWKIFTYGEENGEKIPLEGVIENKKLTSVELKEEWGEHAHTEQYENKIDVKINRIQRVCH